MLNKYQARLFLIPNLAKLGRLRGKSWAELGDKYGREVMLAQAEEVLASSQEALETKSDEPLDIVFLTMMGGHTYNSSIDIAIGLALKSHGHRVRFVVCDQQLPVCEAKKVGKEQDWKRVCSKCWTYGKAIYSKFGLEVIRVSELIAGRKTKSDPERWSEIVEASLLKHFRVGVLDDSEVVRERREEIKKSVAVSSEVGEALVEMAPDRVIMSHGIYSTWGPQRDLLNEAEIPVVTYAKCKKRHAEKFNWTTSADWWDVSDEWQDVRDKPLTEEQEVVIDKYLDSRRDHSGDTVVYNFGEEESKAETFARLGLSPDKPTFVAYTNVLWDAASTQREIVFPDPTTWIFDTIKWFSDRPELQLVVKIHPAEVVIGTKQPFASLIKERIAELPSNIRVIEPQEDVNSWSIMKIADLGLTHTSTIGMEMPLEGIPSAVLSRTHFRERGFTIDVNTREEYFQLIENWNRADYDIEAMKVLAKRYAFLLFERYQLPFPFFHEPEHTDVRAMSFSSVPKLAAHPIMKLIVHSVEEKSDFLLPPDPAEMKKYSEPVS